MIEGKNNIDSSVYCQSCIKWRTQWQLVETPPTFPQQEIIRGCKGPYIVLNKLFSQGQTKTTCHHQCNMQRRIECNNAQYSCSCSHTKRKLHLEEEKRKAHVGLTANH